MKSFFNIIGLHTQSHRASVFLESKFVGGTHFEYSVKSILYVHTHATGLVAGLD